MTDPGDKKREVLARLSKVMIEDILAASEERIIAETREDGQDPAAIATRTRALFEKTVTDSGKALMAAGKAAVVADHLDDLGIKPKDDPLTRPYP